MAVITKRSLTVFDLPSSPYPASGEITIQGEIHPPPRPDGKNGFLEDVEDVDFCIFNRCLVFTTTEPKETMTRSSRHAISNKQRRIGRVPRIWSNWANRSYIMDDTADQDTRFFGLAYEGQPNGKDAREFPVEAGRIAVLVHGAASTTLDQRFLKNPCYGDYLEYIPCDSGARLDPGPDNYGFCIVRNVTPSQFAGGSIGAHSVVHGSRGAKSGVTLDRTVIAYNVLAHAINQAGAATDVQKIGVARLAAKVWTYKTWGIPVGVPVLADPFDDERQISTFWRKAGLSDTAANAQTNLTKLARFFGIDDQGAVVPSNVAANGTVAGMHLFVPDNANAVDGALRLNPFLRLPIKSEGPQIEQDAFFFGSPDAPGFIYHAANALRSNAVFAETESLYIRVITEYKKADGDNLPVARPFVNLGNGNPDDFEAALTQADIEAIITEIRGEFPAELDHAHSKQSAIEHGLVIGIKGNPNTQAIVSQFKISSTNFPGATERVRNMAAATAVDGILTARRANYAAGANRDPDGFRNMYRVSVGAGAQAINKRLESFCQICDGGGNPVVHSAHAAGELMFGAERWNDDAVMSKNQRDYLKDTALKKFVGFPAAIVMSTINAVFGASSFWVEHPDVRHLYGFTSGGNTEIKSMQIQNAGATVDIPLAEYFGIQYREGNTDYTIAEWDTIYVKNQVSNQTFARIGAFHLDPAAPMVLQEAHKLSDALFVPTGAGMKPVDTHPDATFVDVGDDIEQVLAELAAIPPDPRRFIGVFLEQMTDTNEVRVLLRPHMPTR